MLVTAIILAGPLGLADGAKKDGWIIKPFAISGQVESSILDVSPDKVGETINLFKEHFVESMTLTEAKTLLQSYKQTRLRDSVLAWLFEIDPPSIGSRVGPSPGLQN